MGQVDKQGAKADALARRGQRRQLEVVEPCTHALGNASLHGKADVLGLEDHDRHRDLVLAVDWNRSYR